MYRLFGTSKRSSLSTLEDKRAEEIRQHVQAVSVDNDHERPLPVHADRRSADLGYVSSFELSVYCPWFSAFAHFPFQ